MLVKVMAVSVVCATILATARTSDAATSTANMSVTATVEASCSVTVNALAFGMYTVAHSQGANLDATTTVSVTCSNGHGYSIGFGAGGGLGATETIRKMSNGSATLNYALYQDSGRTNVWGNTDGASGNRMTGLTGNGTAQSHTVYGRVPGGQYVTTGNYADTVLLTVHY